MEENHSFVPLLIVVVLAFLAPLVVGRLRRLRLPVVVAEILAGIIVGDSGLGWVTSDQMLEILALLGFAYLMFLSGLEIDFDALLPRPEAWRGTWGERLRNPLSVALLSFALTVGLAALASWGLYALDRADDPWLMMLILSTTSLGLVVPVLKERDLMGSGYGQALLVAAVVADFATMLLVSVYVVLHTHGLTLEVLLVLLLFGTFGTVYRLASAAQRRFPGLGLLNNVSTATAQIDVRGAFAVGLAFIALAQGLGVEIILGAFLGGALIALLAGRGSSDLHHRLDVIGYAFFIPIFFIMVGVRFDLASVLSSPQTLLLVPLLLVAAYAVKLAAALIFRMNYSWRETLGAGALLSSRLSLIIAVSAIGLELGVVDDATNSAIILVALVTCTLSPLLFSRTVPPPARPEAEPVIVVGAHAAAAALAERLTKHGDAVVLAIPGSTGELAEYPHGVRVVQLEGITQESLRTAGAERAKSLVALLPDDAANLRLCQMAAAAFRIPNIVAQVREPTNSEAYAAAGAHPISLPEAQVTVLENLVNTPNVFGLLSRSSPDQEVVELRVADPALDGRPVHALPLPQRAMLMVIQREGAFIAPRGDTRLKLDDVVTILAPEEDFDEICQLFACD
jgi:Kef-type K+ transport system membrane component KefB/Trk K+ transport system NAD-binding subunit